MVKRGTEVTLVEQRGLVRKLSVVLETKIIYAAC
jgi:hypothetical protein